MNNNDNFPAIAYCFCSTLVTLSLVILAVFNPRVDDRIVNGVVSIAIALASGGAGAAHSSRKLEQENKYYSPSTNLNQPNLTKDNLEE